MELFEYQLYFQQQLIENFINKYHKLNLLSKDSIRFLRFFHLEQLKSDHDFYEFFKLHHTEKDFIRDILFDDIKPTYTRLNFVTNNSEIHIFKILYEYYTSTDKKNTKDAKNFYFTRNQDELKLLNDLLPSMKKDYENLTTVQVVVQQNNNTTNEQNNTQNNNTNEQNTTQKKQHHYHSKQTR